MTNAIPNRRAVIDVGTNSVKLLVGDISGPAVMPVSESSKQTRLGAGLSASRRLQRQAIEKTAQAVAEFAKTASRLGASPARVFATCAAREAANVDELTAAIRSASGLEVEVLSGNQEADWVFRGVTTNPSLAGSPLLVLDVGGGSTEIIVGDHAAPQFRGSYPLGTVRLLEQLQPPDPPGLRSLLQCRAGLRDFLKTHVAPVLKPLLTTPCPMRLVGTGGTATILACIHAKLTAFDRDKIESASLTLKEIRQTVESMWQMTLAQRQAIPGLPPSRSDVILTGVAIYEAIMEQFGFEHLSVSTRGLRFWALLRQ